MDQQAFEPANQAVARSTLHSTTSTITTTAQPPEASLLGIPKELLNYIIILTVVEDPDADPVAYLEKHSPGLCILPCDKIRSFPLPPLARTCTTLEAIVSPIYYGQSTFTFRSPSELCFWLSVKRRGYRVALVRRARIHFQKPGRGGEHKYRNAGLEVFLEDKTSALAISIEDPFHACERCRSSLMSMVDEINGFGIGYGGERITALARRLRPDAMACQNISGCTTCWWLAEKPFW